jgi:hypothetical protein
MSGDCQNATCMCHSVPLSENETMLRAIILGTVLMRAVESESEGILVVSELVKMYQLRLQYKILTRH